MSDENLNETSGENPQEFVAKTTGNQQSEAVSPVEQTGELGTEVRPELKPLELSIEEQKQIQDFIAEFEAIQAEAKVISGDKRSFADETVRSEMTAKRVELDQRKKEYYGRIGDWFNQGDEQPKGIEMFMPEPYGIPNIAITAEKHNKRSAGFVIEMAMSKLR